jgi:putative tryptophan/tyrosine transport system substrate-binding protein
MRRRAVVAGLGCAAAWPSPSYAQRIARIGILTTANPRSAPFYQAFEQRLRELGYADGRNVTIEFRDAAGQVERLPDLARELVGLDVNLILTATDSATRAAKQASTVVPIVMIAINYDPFALGYIASLARPGANITGLFFQHLGMTVKRFELFKEMLPHVSRMAVLSDQQTVDQFDEVQAANRAMGAELHPVELRNPPYDFESAFRAAARFGAEALFVLEAASIFRERAQIAALAIANQMPTSFAFREYVDAGGLVSYGVNFATMFRRAAEYADRILRGAEPAELPVEQPTKFDLIINLKTAKALGLTIPPTLLARADEVIE